MFLRYGTVSENELIYVTSDDFCKPLIRSDLRCGDEFVYRHHRTERDRPKREILGDFEAKHGLPRHVVLAAVGVVKVQKRL